MITEASALICELQQPLLQPVVALLTSDKALLPRSRLRHLTAVHCSLVRALQCNFASTCRRSSGAHLTDHASSDVPCLVHSSSCHEMGATQD